MVRVETLGGGGGRWRRLCNRMQLQGKTQTHSARMIMFSTLTLDQSLNTITKVKQLHIVVAINYYYFYFNINTSIFKNSVCMNKTPRVIRTRLTEFTPERTTRGAARFMTLKSRNFTCSFVQVRPWLASEPERDSRRTNVSSSWVGGWGWGGLVSTTESERLQQTERARGRHAVHAEPSLHHPRPLLSEPAPPRSWSSSSYLSATLIIFTALFLRKRVKA